VGPLGTVLLQHEPPRRRPTERAEARQHFFLPRRYRDPFGQNAFVDFEAHDLRMVETRDALGNRVTVEAEDYRVLQPRLVSDPNRNQTEVAFDALGMVVGTAVMGKPLPAPVEGDTLNGFVTEITRVQLDSFFNAGDPHATAAALLKDATTRIVYDLDRFRRTRQAKPNDLTQWQPACAATLARESHVSAPPPPYRLSPRSRRASSPLPARGLTACDLCLLAPHDRLLRQVCHASMPSSAPQPCRRPSQFQRERSRSRHERFASSYYPFDQDRPPVL
jgi:hypothetical protein